MQRRAFVSGTSAGLALAWAGWLRAPRLARADGEAGVLYELSSRPTNYESVRSTFTTRITPVERFYIRNHFDAPAIDIAKWRLEVRGQVGKPLSLAFDDLAKMKQTTVEAVLQCAGNGRGLFTPRVPGVQWRWGAMGNAEWTGVRLADVLAAAGGVGQEAQHLQLQGLEKPTLATTPPFIRGIPIAKAIHADTLIALRMNGKPLSPLHGYPARLVVPGWVGDDWIKWLATIEVRVDEPKGFWYETAYRFPITPGPAGQAVPPEQTKPMTKLFVKSLIGSVSDGDVIAPGAHELVGVAFSGESKIAKVDVTVDGGATWQAAKLDGPDTPYGFRVFRYAWNAAAGKAKIGSRATDAAGAVQPADAVWNPSGYLHNAIDYANVEVKS